MNRKWSGVAFYLALLAMLIFGIYLFKPNQRGVEEISYTTLVNIIDEHKVKSIDLKGTEAVITKNDQDIVRTSIPPMVWDSFYKNHLQQPVEDGDITFSACLLYTSDAADEQ